jgi:hypothetical protein
MNNNNNKKPYEPKKEHGSGCSCSSCMTKQKDMPRRENGNKREDHKDHGKKPGCCD